MPRRRTRYTDTELLEQAPSGIIAAPGQSPKDCSRSDYTKNNPHQDLSKCLSQQPSFSWRLSHISLNGKATILLYARRR
jgi:hypothetical protein